MTSANPNPLLDEFRWPLRIYWEDTDAGGVVFYANYLKFFERARTEWLRTLGFSQQAMRLEDQAMFVVTDTQVRHRQPARLDDLVEVTVRVAESGRASLVLEQQAWRDGTLLAEGRIRIGWVQTVLPEAPGAEPRLKTGRIPQRILARLPEAMPAAAAHQD